MNIPIQRFFRILVVGEDSGQVARIIEEELHFMVTSVPTDQVAQAIRTSADVGAIVVTRANVEAVIAAREERGLRMPVFLLSSREDATFDEPFLGRLDGIMIAEQETRDFYSKRLIAAVREYAVSLRTPFFGALMQYDFDANRTWA